MFVPMMTVSQFPQAKCKMAGSQYDWAGTVAPSFIGDIDIFILFFISQLWEGFIKSETLIVYWLFTKHLRP